MDKDKHIKEKQEYIDKIKPRIKECASVKEPIEILETFSIKNHKVSLLQVNIENVLKFGVTHSYGGVVGILSYCDLYNKKEVANSLYNKICKDLKYRYKDLEQESTKELNDEIEEREI